MIGKFFKGDDGKKKRRKRYEEVEPSQGEYLYKEPWDQTRSK